MQSNYRKLVYRLCDVQVLPLDEVVWLRVEHERDCLSLWGLDGCDCDAAITVDGLTYRYSHILGNN